MTQHTKPWRRDLRPERLNWRLISTGSFEFKTPSLKRTPPLPSPGLQKGSAWATLGWPEGLNWRLLTLTQWGVWVASTVEKPSQKTLFFVQFITETGTKLLVLFTGRSSFPLPLSPVILPRLIMYRASSSCWKFWSFLEIKRRFTTLTGF